MSLGVQLAAGMLVVVTLVSVVVFFEVSQRERKSLVRAKTTAASAVGDLFAATVAAPLDFGDADAVRSELKNLEANRDVVYAAAWAAASAEPVAEVARGPIVRPALSSLGQASLTVVDDAVEVSRPVRNVQQRVVGTTFIRFSLAAENAAFAETRRGLLAACVAMGALTLGLLLLIARRQILTPLESLLRAARKVQRGEQGDALAIGTNDEIGRLARAFNEMRGAIHDREERLATANESLQELFDNMRQVIVVVGADGAVIGSGSRSADHLFGGPTEAKRLVDLLHPEANANDPEAAALEQWLELVFTTPASSWESMADLAPREVVLRAGEADERVLALEFRPIVGAAERESVHASAKGRAHDRELAPPVRVMLLATDETETRRLVKEARLRGEAHEREMAAMRQLLAGRGEGFALFLGGVRERFSRCEELLGASGGEPRGGALDEMLQHAHTVKGEARAFDLDELAEAMSTLEQQLRTARIAFDAPREAGPPTKTSASGSTREAIALGFESARAMIDRAEALFIQVSPHGKDALDRVSVKKSDISRLVEMVGERDDELGRVAARLSARPFGESASILAEKVPTWAEAQGKRARLILGGREVLVPADLSRVLGGVLTHLVRNAIAHGVESPSERAARGKPLEGTLDLTCEDRPEGVRVVLEDDGEGIAAEAVEKRARAAGIWRDGMRAEEAIFAPNFSMIRGPAREAAGLGVGLSAVRADLEGIGYRIGAERAERGGSRFVVQKGVGK